MDDESGDDERDGLTRWVIEEVNRDKTDEADGMNLDD